jgi:hypothetical protein
MIFDAHDFQLLAGQGRNLMHGCAAIVAIHQLLCRWRVRMLQLIMVMNPGGPLVARIAACM